MENQENRWIIRDQSTPIPVYERASDTDLADKYDHWPRDIEPSEHRGIIGVSILECLKGQPWNNLALNYISAFGPAKLKVTSITDAFVPPTEKEIRVMLDKDDRTIFGITMYSVANLDFAGDFFILGMQLTHQIKFGNLHSFPYQDTITYTNKEE